MCANAVLSGGAHAQELNALAAGIKSQLLTDGGLGGAAAVGQW